MKIILSRKGFDDQYGCFPSPIMPDNKMLSLPIPIENEGERGLFSTNIYYDNETMEKLCNKLGINTNNNEYHLDPDIRYSSLPGRSSNWKGSFGQAGSALGHLKKNNVGSGDVFLFYGTFNYTKNIDGQLKYQQSYPFHAIWGYLIVDSVVYDMDRVLEEEENSFLVNHPHYINRELYKNGNAIYVGNRYGVFTYSDKLRLTKIGYKKSYWSLPGFFRSVSMSYNRNRENYYDKYNDRYEVYTVGKGQEFVCDGNKYIDDWLLLLGVKNNN